ncbi:hypothetical protein E4N72_03740 [Treponema vincentii]|uniref:InlB B-repeat-containing protein n=1 Tax=Treponema vincentii TaxID=69710 RepID=UPI0020A37583|nr:InlB B-repeat-containing protein [Treponema vincentii]UTC45752.1 hypothetical protein E4N72_03740 [Treponema vincentii]
MRKAFIILTGILFTLLSAACRPFTADIGSYLGYWSSEAFVVSADINTETQNDASGMVSVASAKDVIITLKVQNPKSFKLVMPSASETRNIVNFAQLTGTKPVVDSDYTLEQPDDDRKVLTLTYKAGFLQNSEWGEKDVSSTITLYADDGREFKYPYTFKIKANTPPATPGFTVAKTKDLPAYYVLCITVPDMDKKVQGSRLLHKDITRIEVNGTPYPFSVNEAENRFEKPESGLFMSYSAVEKLDDSDAADVPSGGWVLYYKTDVEVREGAAKKDYTVRLADAKGLVSGILNASTKPNKAEAEKVDITKGRKIAGSGNSEGDPVIIACDSTGAELKVSSATAGVTVHGTLTAGTAESTQYNGNPITVPLPLNGAGEKTYKLEYYTDGGGFARTDVKTVYYKILKGHTVTFDANGGSYPDGTTAVSKVALHGMAVSAPDPRPKKQGFGVTGWYKDKACSAGKAWNFATDTVTGDMTLYAQWTAGADTPYKVEHYQQNIDETYPATAIYSEEKTGTTGALLSVGNGITPRTDAGFEYDKLEPASPAIGADGKTVVKVYYKRKTYTVNFSVDGSGGTISAVVTGGSITSPSSASVKYGGSIAFTATPTDATRHKVGGWSCTPSAEGFTVESGLATASLTVTAKATVSVQFVPLNALTVKKFEIHGKDASNGSVSLDYKDAQIAQDDIKLEFNEHSGLTFTTDPLLPLTLEEGNTKKLTIIVAGSPGQYPEWKKEITITRNKNHVANLTSFTLNGETKNAPFKSEYIVASKTAEVTGLTSFDADSTGATASVSPTGSVTIPEGTGQHFTITVKAQDDTTKTIEFTVKRKKYNVTFSVDGGTGGTLKAKPEGGTASTTTATGTVSVEHGTQVDFTADPTNTDWKVAEWSSNVTPSSDKKQATLSNVTAATTVTVKFYQSTLKNPATWKDLARAVKSAPDNAVITIDGEIKATSDAENNGEIVINKNLTIKRATGASSAVIDANKDTGSKPTHRIFKVKSGNTLTLENLTLTGGKAEGTQDADNYGGAIYASGATVNITNCTLKGNEAVSGGGAIYARKEGSTASTITISGGTIGGTGTNEKNKVTGKWQFGGGILVEIGCTLTLNKYNGQGVQIIGNEAWRAGGVRANRSTVTMTDCTIKNNKTTGNNDSGGGGVYTFMGTLTMTGCTITGNEAATNGGGLNVEGTTTNITNCTFTGNTAKNGGGIYTKKEEGTPPTVTISGGTIGGTDTDKANKATGTDSDGNGGGIYVGEDCKVTLQNNGSTGCTITGNTAQRGGGVYNEGTLIMKGSAVVTPATGSEANSKGKNDVYLVTGKITVDGTLSNNPAARITPESYTVTQVLQAGSGVTLANEVGKFTVTQPNSSTQWYIDNSGALKPLDTASVANATQLYNAIQSARDGVPLVITITQGFTIDVASLEIKDRKNITIQDNGTSIILDCPNRDHKYFCVENGGKLTLQGKITLRGGGLSGTERHALYVKTGGTAEIKDEVTITNFKGNAWGGCVYIDGTYITGSGSIGGKLTMSGGKITGNSAMRGGGVFIANGGIFEMTGGSIEGNAVTHHEGRAMYISGTFNWTGGTITGHGGAVNEILHKTSDGHINNTSGNTAS